MTFKSKRVASGSPERKGDLAWIGPTLLVAALSLFFTAAVWTLSTPKEPVVPLQAAVQGSF